MKKIFTIVAGLALITACSNATNEVATNENVKEISSEKEVVQVTPNQLLTMEISGMSCEMACGGAIREGLIETGAVARVQYIDFNMDEETNVAKVYFDDSKISKEKIVEIVSSLNKNQFTVGKTRIDSYSEATSSLEYPESGSNDQSVETMSISTDLVALPNLFDVLRSIFLN